MGILSNLLKNQSESTLSTLDQASTPSSGSGFAILESDVYKVKIKDMYNIMSKKGAIGIRLILGYGDNYAKEYKEDIYISDREKRFTYTKDKKEYPLPGYSLINDICGLTVGTSLAAVSENTVEQMKKVYDFTTKSEINESHETYVDMIDQIFIAGIIKQEETKKEFGSDGQLYDTDQTRMTNHIRNVFAADTKNNLYELDHAEGEDVPEAKAYEQWVEYFKGKTIDKTTKSSNSSFEPKTARQASAAAPRRSLRRNA